PTGLGADRGVDDRFSPDAFVGPHRWPEPARVFWSALRTPRTRRPELVHGAWSAGGHRDRRIRDAVVAGPECHRGTRVPLPCDRGVWPWPRRHVGRLAQPGTNNYVKPTTQHLVLIWKSFSVRPS